MIPGDVVFESFINANILFIVAFALWKLARLALDRVGMKHAYATQLKLLNTAFLAIICSPFLIMGVTALQQSLGAQVINVNLSDMAVSYYLNGGLEIRATEFERFVSMRDTYASDILRADSWLAITVLSVFAAGTAIGFARLARSIFCLIQVVRHSYASRSYGRLKIRVSDRTLVPFSTRGPRNYYVVIPSNMLGNSSDLRVSLAHEFQHLRQGDIEWEILLEVLKPLFFVNPAYHAWKRQVEDLRELACDSNVLITGRIGIKAYADTLLSVCQLSLRRDRMFVVAMPKVTLVTTDRGAQRDGKPSFLEHRIATLFDMPKLRHPKLVYAAVVFPLLAVLMVLAVAIQRPGDWSQDRLMLSTVVNLERLDKINRISSYRALEQVDGSAQGALSQPETDHYQPQGLSL